MRRRVESTILAVAASLLVAAAAATGAAAHNDPYIGTWEWPANFQGTYRFDSSFTRSWMQSAVNRAAATIGHMDAQSPDFDVHADGHATNGVVSLRSNGNSCNGIFSKWGACAQYSPTARTWTLWFATQWCWTDGSYQTCSDAPPYDVESVALNELGHIATLDHHLPISSHNVQGDATYGEAVVQAVPDPFSHSKFGVRHSLGTADHGALHARYGTDPSGCYPPPCPLSVEP